MEAVRFGRLFPQQPYTVRVNTFRVPSVESTLLRTFSKGTNYIKSAAPLIFCDTLRQTHAAFVALHASDAGDDGFASGSVKDALWTLAPLKWTLTEASIMWTPKHMDPAAPASQYTLLIALYWRINGASHLYGTVKSKDENLREKMREFIDGHLPLAMRLDALEGPHALLDSELLPLEWVNVASGGPTEWLDDRDLVERTTRILGLEVLPYRVLGNPHEQDTREVLSRLAAEIRNNANDEEVERFFSPEEPELLDYYYPLRKCNARDIREHSWFFACLLVINRSWGAVRTHQQGEDTPDLVLPPLPDPATTKKKPGCRGRKPAQPVVCDQDEDADADDDDNDNAHDDDELNQEAETEEEWMAGRKAYAQYRIMAGFIPLLYATCGTSIAPHSDRAWRRNLDGEPSPFDKYFPDQAACFHAGDLPALDCLFDQVGLFGVQAVKGKVPLVKLLIKALPICCQSRDLRETFLKECRGVNSEGYWRVVRSIFWVGLTGLYPHAQHRVSFRDAMRIYHLLFHDKEGFLAALEFESKERKAWLAEDPARKKEKKEAATKTCQLIEVVMREYFVHSVRNNRNWIDVVSKRIKWDEFVAKTKFRADEMRRYGRFADAPTGNDFVHAIDALTRAKAMDKVVYRFRKKEYVPTILDAINVTQDELHEKRREEGKEVMLIEAMLDRLVEAEILDEDDMAPLLGSRHLVPRFGGDPMGLFARSPAQFAAAVRAAARDSRHIYDHNLGFVVPTDIKVNIINFLLRTPPDRRFDFDVLLDPRLGGVRRETVQTLAKTQHIYQTRSSPKSIKAQVQNMPINDLRTVGWYFNIVSRFERFNLIPLDATTIEQQGWAMRSYRFRLMPNEPLPPGAFTIYVCICCRRIATFSDSSMYGNFGVSYDPRIHNMVCSKKVTRAARVRHKPVDASAVLDNDVERAKKESQSRQKKARAERKEDNSLPCEGQPVIPVDMYGVALEFDGDRFLFCPGCGQFHTYRDTGWGRGGYRCKGCRERETPLAKMGHCAHCEGTQDLHTVEILCTGKDPSDPQHSLLFDPPKVFQTLRLCQKCSNSVGLYERHRSRRKFTQVDKQELFRGIGPATQERSKKNHIKFNN